MEGGVFGKGGVTVQCHVEGVNRLGSAPVRTLPHNTMEHSVWDYPHMWKRVE